MIHDKVKEVDYLGVLSGYYFSFQLGSELWQTRIYPTKKQAFAEGLMMKQRKEAQL